MICPPYSLEKFYRQQGLEIMSKKICKIICVISLVLSFLSAIPLITIILQIPKRPEIGIIGGADSPTYFFIVENLLFRHPLFYITLVCLTLFIVSLIVLLVKVICKK